MIFQAYLLFFLICTLICVIAIAKHFYGDHLIDKENAPSFWGCWLKFPNHKELVSEHVRSLLIGLYWVQAVTFVILVLATIFGDYSL